MAKGAITSLTYAAATDWSKFGITVNVIFPATVTEPMRQWMAISQENRQTIESAFPVGYVGESDRDLGPVILFLASDASHYLTGHPSSSMAELRAPLDNTVPGRPVTIR